MHACRLYPAHEYTMKNLGFALSIDPHNAALQSKARWCQQQRATPGAFHGAMPTIPSTVAEELGYNVFFRADELQATMGETDAVRALAKIRAAKDSFKG